MSAQSYWLCLWLMASPPQLVEVKALISSKGAGNALSELTEDNSRWESVLTAIGGGTSPWLDVAAQLRPVSDGGATLGLRFAIQEALPKNPHGVLGLVASGAFTVEDACDGYGFGQIEDKRPDAVLQALVAKRISVVGGVTDVKLAGVRKQCLERLDTLRSLLSRSGRRTSA